MNARMAVVYVLVVLSASQPFASFAASRTPRSPRGASAPDARLAPAFDNAGLRPGSVTHRRSGSTLAFGREAATSARVYGPASRVSVPDGVGGLYISWADGRDGASDIFLLRVTNTGAVASGWPADGLPVCNAPGNQFQPIIMPDNANGVIVAWLDYRSDWKTADGYAQRVNSAGVSQWTTNGVKVVSGLSVESAAAAPDGSGGLLVAWSKLGLVDKDVFATRFTGAGALATGWSASGDLVCGLAEDQVGAVVTADGGGGAIIAWQDARAGGGNTHIYAQRLNATAAPQWGANGMLLDASPTSMAPEVCSDGAGGAFVFWEDFASTEVILGQRVNNGGTVQWAAGGLGVPGSDLADALASCVADGTGSGIVTWDESPGGIGSLRAQRVDTNGAQQWGAAGASIVSLVNSSPFLWDVVPAGGGAAFFIWEDQRNSATPGNGTDIFAQRVTSSGTVSWTANGEPVCVSVGEQFSPVGAPDGSGGLLVAWLDVRNFAIDLFAQRLSSAGAAQLPANGAAVYLDPGVQVGQLIVQTDQGGAFLFYHQKVSGQWDIRARKFDADGTPSGPSVSICSAAGNQFLDAVIDDGAGGAIVAWTDDRGADENLYVQRVDINGTPQWTPNGVAICTASGRQESARMTSDGAGGAILAWQDERSASNPDIYARRVNSAGVAQWTANGVAVCADPSFQQEAVITSDGAGGAIVAWSDQRTIPSPSLYAQRLDNAGNAQWAPNGLSIATFAGFGFNVISGAVTAPSNSAIILVNRTTLDLVTGEYTNALHVQEVNGSGAAQWGASGATVCDVASFCEGEQLVEDGSGGAYVAWTDGRSGVYDIYAQRVDATGTAMWTGDGVGACTASGWQVLGSVTRHAGGDLFLTWGDERGGQSDIYAHRIGSAAGAPVWAANGLPVCSVTRGQYSPAIAPYKTASPEREFVAWTDNRAGNERYVFLQRLDSAGAPQWAANGVTRTSLALVSADADRDHVRLVWYASDQVTATVYRRTADQDWIPVGEAASDGTGQVVFDDREVVPGARYGYRLGYFEAGQQAFAGEVWVEIPSGLRLALGGLEPNPATRDLMVSFTLPSGDAATLEMLDVAGRRVLVRELAGLSPGRHTLRLDEAAPPAGVYFLRLTQKGRTTTARAAILR